MTDVSVSSKGIDQLNIFYQVFSPSDSFYHLQWNGGWSPLQHIRDGDYHSSVSALSIIGTDTIHMVSVNYNPSLGPIQGPIYKRFDGHTWSSWKNLEGKLIYSPVMTSWAPDRLDVFGIGTDSALCHMKSIDRGLRWSPWERIGGEFTSSPSAVSWSKDRIDIVGRGVDTAVWHYWGNGNDGKWYRDSLGGQLWESSGPTITSWAPDRLDVFGIGTDARVWHTYWAGGPKWSVWEDLPAPPRYPDNRFGGSPGAVSWTKDRIDIFAQTTDKVNSRALLHTYWNGNNFVMPWEEVASY